MYASKTRAKIKKEEDMGNKNTAVNPGVEERQAAAELEAIFLHRTKPGGSTEHVFNNGYGLHFMLEMEKGGTYSFQ